jgi:diguanylate cyclase (GGDEF)-like protein
MSAPLHRRLRARIAACAFGALACLAIAAPPPSVGTARWVAGSLEDKVDQLARQAQERAAPAAAELERLRDDPAVAASAEATRTVLHALAVVHAQNGRPAEAEALAVRVAGHGGDPLARASAELLRAVIADAAGKSELAASLAQSAVVTLQAGCTRSRAAWSPPVAVLPGAGCDYRAAWRALRLLQRRASSLGAPSLATAHEQAALDLATAAGDSYRRATGLSMLAVLAAQGGQGAEAASLVQRARREADAAGDPVLQSLLRSDEARVAEAGHDTAGMLRAREEAHALAVRADAPRSEVKALANLADVYLRLGRFAEALQAADKGLVAVQGQSDPASEMVLLNNAGLAKIGLGRLAEGKRDMARMIDLWRTGAAPSREAETLREFGEALAAAGDAPSALEAYHRERELNAALMRSNGAAALKELQLRNDAQAKQRNIELLARDNALKTEELANGDLRQRVWILVAAVLAVAAMAAVLLFRRVREINRRLNESHLRLRQQSERDPLTDLANRRRFQSVMAQQGGEGGFEGALLLVDIDHFKRINDDLGHAAGDAVIVEVARRLTQATRSDDLVVRWGGEEFLILAPNAGPAQAEQMAGRVLRLLSESPITVEGRSVQVTASVGYARFPLPPHRAAVAWEQAVNLVDLALYTAKNEGRGRAVGLRASTASNGQMLRAVESDFERARQDGRVSLLETVAGP